jgi:hypothetical protein
MKFLVSFYKCILCRIIDFFGHYLSSCFYLKRNVNHLWELTQKFKMLHASDLASMVMHNLMARVNKSVWLKQTLKLQSQILKTTTTDTIKSITGHGI